jgi:hypothetical protein
MGESQEDWDNFKAGLKVAWAAIPDTLVIQLLRSVPQRLAAAIKTKGY